MGDYPAARWDPFDKLSTTLSLLAKQRPDKAQLIKSRDRCLAESISV